MFDGLAGFGSTPHIASALFPALAAGRYDVLGAVGHPVATVDVSGVKRQVNIACIVDEEHPAESCVGNWVLVHVGFAMSRIDEAQAAETLKILTELGEAQAEIEAMRQSAMELGRA